MYKDDGVRQSLAASKKRSSFVDHQTFPVRKGRRAMNETYEREMMHTLTLPRALEWT